MLNLGDEFKLRILEEYYNPTSISYVSVGGDYINVLKNTHFIHRYENTQPFDDINIETIYLQPVGIQIDSKLIHICDAGMSDRGVLFVRWTEVNKK